MNQVMHYYTRHIGDYAKDTGHLSLLEHGVYTVLLDWSYATERTLPEEKEALYRICRAQNAVEKKAVDKVVAEFFPKRQDGSFNKRVCVEIAGFRKKSESSRKANEVRWHSERTPNGLHPDSEGSPTRARVPLTNNQEPIEGGAGSPAGEQVSDNLILDFCRSFPGEQATGTPVMPEQWAVEKVKALNGRRDWPTDWKRWLIACWRAEYRTWKPQAGGQKKSGEKTAGVSGETAAQRLFRLNKALEAARIERDAMQSIGDDWRPAHAEVERLEKELEANE